MPSKFPTAIHTRKGLGLLGRDRTEVSQIALVTDKHNNDIGVGMVAEFLKPPGDILVGLMLANVVDEKGTNGAAVVGGCDSAVSLLAGCVPNLSLDGLGVDLNRSGGKLDTDSGLRIEVEFVSGESTQQVGLADAGVSDEDDCPKVSKARAKWPPAEALPRGALRRSGYSETLQISYL